MRAGKIAGRPAPLPRGGGFFKAPGGGWPPQVSPPPVAPPLHCGGDDSRAAVEAFQQAHDLEPTGVVDESTWELPLRDRAPALVDRTLSAGDIEGPFVPVPEDMMEKSRLPQLAYQSPLERLGEAVHASPDLLKRLSPRATFAREGEVVRVRLQLAAIVSAGTPVVLLPSQ